MKKITTYFMMFAMAALMISCGGSPNEQMYGTWKHTDVAITNADGSELSADKNEVKNDLIKSILSKNTTYEFKAGEGDLDIYTQTTTDGVQKGSFTGVELDGKIEVLLSDDSDGQKASTISIEEITEDKMTVGFDMDGMKVTYVYTKQ